MHYSTALALASVAGLATSTPIESRDVAQFPSGTTWDILLFNEGFTFDELKNAVGTAIDIDLFDNTADGSTTVKDLAETKKVICYFSAGSREDWRDDADQFTSSDYGQVLEGWPGENWLNVTSANVRAIMKARIEFAAASGCTAVDPDNVDGFDGDQDGFHYDKSVYAEYVNYLAGIAKTNNLAIGLKNALDIIPDVIDNIQFAVNEQCHDNDECTRYVDVTTKGLAVFNIEYGGSNCTQPAGVVLSEVIKPDTQSLNTLGGQCT